MNGSHVRSKLKIHNRILAIFVAFLLLSLMIPHAVFATESTDANLNDAAKDVNNEGIVNAEADLPDTPVAEVESLNFNEDTSLNTSIASNGYTVPGMVYDGSSNPISGAQVTAYFNNEVVGTAETGYNGMYMIDIDEKVGSEDFVFMRVDSPTGQNYGHQIGYVGARTNTNWYLNEGVSYNFGPGDAEQEGIHENFNVEITVDGNTMNAYTDTYSGYVPVGAKYHMTHNAKLDIEYSNCLNQSVVYSVKGIANDELYRPYYWGQSVDSGVGEALPIDKIYTTETGHSYELGIFYKGQGVINFSSVSEFHDLFHFTFNKNGTVVQDFKDKELATSAFVGTKCVLQSSGDIVMTYSDTDETYTYEVVATIQPIAKDGYEISGWTLNDKEFNIGDEAIVEFADDLVFEANYKSVNEGKIIDDVQVSGAAKTGDANYLWVIALSGLALSAAVVALRFKRN